MQAEAVRTCLCLGCLWSSLQQHHSQLAVSSRMASDELGAAPVRGHHLGTVELTDWCTLQVRVGAPIDMLGPCRAGRGRERCTRSQKSWFQALPNVL